MKKSWLPQIIISLFLVLALGRHPYGYYVLLRWGCCLTFAYLAVKAKDISNERWVWILGITAVIYNPIIKIHLSREIWSVINLATVGIALASIFTLNPNRRTS
jgi:hypothetical protein